MLDTPTLPAAACAGAYVAPVERERGCGLAKPSPQVSVGHLSGQSPKNRNWKSNVDFQGCSWLGISDNY